MYCFDTACIFGTRYLRSVTTQFVSAAARSCGKRICCGRLYKTLE